MDQWYVLIDGQQTGPITLADLRQQVAAGAVTAEHLVWTQGMAEWVKAGSVRELFPAGPIAPVQYPYPFQLPSAPGAVASLVCGIVGVVFAWLFCLGLILGVIAIRQSNKAKRAIDANPRTYGGRGIAVAGFVLGIIATALGAFWTVYFLVIFVAVAVAGLSSL